MPPRFIGGPPVAAASAPCVIGLLAAHISRADHLIDLRSCLASISQQHVPPDATFISWSASPPLIAAAEQLMSGTGLDWLHPIFQPSPLSQFEHYAYLATSVPQWLSSRGVRAASTWLFFSDDDDVWHPERAAVFRNAIIAARRTVNSSSKVHALHCKTFATEAADPEQFTNSQICRTLGAATPARPTPTSAQQVDQWLTDGRATRGNPCPSEFWQYAVKLRVFARFVAAAPAALLRCRFCDVAFRSLLAFPRADMPLMVFDAPADNWMYYYSRRRALQAGSMSQSGAEGYAAEDAAVQACLATEALRSSTGKEVGTLIAAATRHAELAWCSMYFGEVEAAPFCKSVDPVGAAAVATPGVGPAVDGDVGAVDDAIGVADHVTRLADSSGEVGGETKVVGDVRGNAGEAIAEGWLVVELVTRLVADFSRFVSPAQGTGAFGRFVSSRQNDKGQIGLWALWTIVGHVGVVEIGIGLGIPLPDSFRCAWESRLVELTCAARLEQTRGKAQLEVYTEKPRAHTRVPSVSRRCLPAACVRTASATATYPSACVRRCAVHSSWRLAH